MAKSVSISKEDLEQLWETVSDYFAHLGPDEVIAWSAVGAGFVLFVIGFILL